MIVLVAIACLGPTAVAAKPQIPKEEISDGLPPWMTKGEEVRLAVVRELLETDNTLESLTIIRDMRTKGFDSAELDLLQGKALRLDGVTSEAESLLLRARKRLEGKDPRANEELCLLYADLSRIEEAIDACRRATLGDKATASGFNNLGYLLLSAGRAEEAREASEMAVELDGAEPRFRNNLGMSQAACGQTDQAFRTFKSTMKGADAAYMVGVTLERFGKRDGAESWYQKALNLDPKHVETRLRLDGLTEVGQAWDEPTPIDETAGAPPEPGDSPPGVQDGEPPADPR
jgi:Flp pilus assembly protein TadD